MRIRTQRTDFRDFVIVTIGAPRDITMVMLIEQFCSVQPLNTRHLGLQWRGMKGVFFNTTDKKMMGILNILPALASREKLSYP